LRAAFAITALPVWPEPVKKRWSKGSEEKAGPRPPPSSKNWSFSGGKYFGATAISRRASPVAGGEDGGERREGQHQRKVPRHDHPDDAQRLGDHPVARGRVHHQVDLALLRLHPFL
jgi:hypothetical protein